MSYVFIERTRKYLGQIRALRSSCGSEDILYVKYTINTILCIVTANIGQLLYVQNITTFYIHGIQVDPVNNGELCFLKHVFVVPNYHNHNLWIHICSLEVLHVHMLYDFVFNDG